MKNTKLKMKNTIKIIGIIALAAVIGFTMAGCRSAGGSILGRVSLPLWRYTNANAINIIKYEGNERNAEFNIMILLEPEFDMASGNAAVNFTNGKTSVVGSGILNTDEAIRAFRNQGDSHQI